MSKPPFLSVIVPVYKQEKTLKKNIEQIVSSLESTPYSFEILPIVDGSSSDKSLQVAKKIKDPRVHPAGYKFNLGKGYAVRYGMARAKGEIVTFIDAGMDIDPQGIVMLLEHMKWYDADIIIGSKLHAASLVQYPFKRRILTYAYYILVKILFGLKVRDTQTGLKAYKRIVLEKVLPRLVVKQFAFDIEVLAVANRIGYKRIFDAPVKVNLDFGKTTINFWGNNGILPILWDTFAVWYRLNILRYYDGKYKRDRIYSRDLGMFVSEYTKNLGSK